MRKILSSPPLKIALFALAIGVIVAACSGSDSTSANGDSTATTESSAAGEPGERGFAAEVLPVIEDNCARCHTGDGPGTPHVRMDTVGDVLANADLIEAAVRDGVMPPWPASGESVAFEGSWDITDRERSAIVTWAGFNPSVDVDEATPIVSSVGVRGLDEVEQTLTPQGSYDGVAFQPDEYRCFIYETDFEETSWIAGYEFVPDQTEVVHHAIGYRIPGELLGAAQSLDRLHPEQGGWPCFGSSGLGEDEIFLGWAPGQGPTEFPDGSALRFEAGDFIVLQVHYHFEIDAPPDASTLEIDLVDDPDGIDEVEVVEFLAPAEIPCIDGEEGPLCDRDTAIAAAIEKYGREGVRADETLLFCRASVEDFADMTDGRASSSCDLPARASGTIVSVLGHEHELGSSFRMTLNPGEDDELVVLDIPDWDFDWQLNYYPAEEIRIEPGDWVRIECSWDKERRDPALEPAYIVWADGTDDEMCFATITVREG